MSRYFLTLILFVCFLRVNAQEVSKDSSIVRASKDLGLYVGAAYSLNQLKASAYTIGEFEGVPDLKNSQGILAGFCYNLYAGKRLIVRPAVEAVFMPTTISYQTEIDYSRDQRVFPVTVEMPLSFILSSFRTKAFPRPKAKAEVGVSLRPVLTIKALNDLEPALKTYNFQSDIFVGYPFSNDKTVTRVELFYSHGWMNLIGEGTDYRTASIQRLYRSAVGIRAIFH